MTQATIHVGEGLQSKPLLSSLNLQGFNQHRAFTEIPPCVFLDAARLPVARRDSKVGRERGLSSTISAQPVAPSVLSPMHIA